MSNKIEILFNLAHVNCRSTCTHALSCSDIYNCWACEERKIVFPAETQLNLIKWIIKKDIQENRIINYNKTYDSFINYVNYYTAFREETEGFDTFEEALAGAILHFWEFYNDKDKAEIKRILEQ